MVYNREEFFRALSLNEDEDSDMQIIDQEGDFLIDMIRNGDLEFFNNTKALLDANPDKISWQSRASFDELHKSIAATAAAASAAADKTGGKRSSKKISKKSSRRVSKNNKKIMRRGKW